MIGHEIHALAKRLFPLNRSLTGEGVRETLRQLQAIHPSLKILEVPSGTPAFDWTVPKEWAVSDAYIITPSGQKICEFKKNNLHLVGYSAPIRKKVSYEELDKHLYSLPEQPNAIPYITSYYQERWGFCISHQEKIKLEKNGSYEVVVESELFDGNLSYGELILPGKRSDEIFLSTYVCHPSMANNELSGPTVTTYLAKWLSELPSRNFTYRIIFIPETIGSIVYLSRNLAWLKKHVVAGFNISCIGDNRAYSYIPSRNGETLSDRSAQHVLRWIAPQYRAYTWADRGSDERQYCAPGVDLPIASIMRTKFAEFPEYHTSLDDLENVVTPEGLEGGYLALQRAIEALERHCYPKVTTLCEPQLGKRGLYPTLSTKATADQVRLMMDFLTWCDGKHSLLEIADLCKVPVWALYPLMDQLASHDLIQAEQELEF